MVKLSDLFEINYGQRIYHNKENLTEGSNLLISSQGQDNGCYGFFDIPIKYKAPFITVPSTGSIGESFIQLNDCCVDDNTLVLIPKKEFSTDFLYYVAVKIRNQKWRFMYGRQITPEKLGKLEVLEPENVKINIDYKSFTKSIIPRKQEVSKIKYNVKTKEFLLSNLFDIITGHYHSINNLNEGDIPLISCSENDNGISGFFDIPKKDIYENMITITYDGRPLTAKYHNYKFTSYDNVGILKPKKDYKKTTIIFIALMINMEKWRYSYGRKCYKQKVEKLKLSLPVNNKDELDESFIEKIMSSRDLFGYFNKLK